VLYSATPVGAKTMFMQIHGAIHHLLASSILSHNTNNLRLNLQQNVFCKVQDGVPFELKNNIHRPNTKAPAIDENRFQPALCSFCQIILASVDFRLSVPSLNISYLTLSRRIKCSLIWLN
jgi:hypothetical protein